MTTPSSRPDPLPVVADRLADQLLAVYTRAEIELLAELAGFARTHVGHAQANMLARMRRAAERTAAALRLRSGPMAQIVAGEAARAGDASAVATLRHALEQHPDLVRLYTTRVLGVSGHGAASAAAVRLDLQHGLEDVTRRITRFGDDAYRAAVAEPVTRLVAGAEGLTPSTTRVLAWRNLTRQGITGFVDQSGRGWNLSSYVEMAGRTATQRAYNASHEARMVSVGIQYFTVPSDGHPCPLCRPWEGRVLSNHRAGVVTEKAADSDRLVAFTVHATINEARAAGLWHPNCRHTLSPYFPGVTKTTPPGEWTADDQARYDSTQRLRTLERAVRQAKREQAAALTDGDRRLAAARVRAAQARIRQHLAEHPGLNRRPARERIDLGAGTKAPSIDTVRTPDYGRQTGTLRADLATPEPAREPDLGALTDDDLAGLLATDDAAQIGRVVAELDRRDERTRAAQRRQAVKAARQDVLDQQFGALIEEGADPEVAYAQVYGVSVERQRRDTAIAALRANGYKGRGFAELSAAAHRDYVEQAYLDAEQVTRGHMLNGTRGTADTRDVRRLFTGNEAYARANASEELLAYWQEHGRLTLADFRASLLGGQLRLKGGAAWI